MPSSPNTLDRPLRLRARPDIVAHAARVPGGGRWVVSDPVTRGHFELSEEEHALLTWLSGDATLRELQKKFAKRFAPRQIDVEELWRFLSRLHREGLAVSAGPGQSDELWRRERERRRDEWRWAWTRLLAIRLPSFDPDRLLTALYGAIGWLFRPWALLPVGAVMLVAVAIAVTHASDLAVALPTVDAFVEPRNLVWLAVIAVGVKALHELGHALACKHFGGDVREMGVMLLAFAPCLYCDVSDLWRLPSRWKRMVVSAAGMLVELFLAAVAVIVWRLAEPGVVSSLAVGVMIVCTVGTLLVNANPLLRYDGYYLLADLTNTSNLWQRSREAVRERLSRLFLRHRAPARPLGSWRLAAYGLASQVYVLLIVGTIFWLALATLKPLRLESVAWAVGAVSVAALAAGPLRGIARWGRHPAALQEVRGGRVTLAIVLAAVLIGGGLQTPWSYTVDAEGATVLAASQQVVTTTEGRLVRAAAPGDRVVKGQVIAQLFSPQIERELLELRGQLAQEELRVAQLERLRARDPEARDALPAAAALARDLRRRLDDRLTDAERLTLRAPRDGIVIAPPWRPREIDGRKKLAHWVGSPLDSANRGAWLAAGTLVCLVGDPERVAAEAILPEADVDRLRLGQAARVALAQTPGLVLAGRVVEVADEATRVAPQRAPAGRLTNWSPLEPPPAAPGAFYRVRVELDPHTAPLLLGGSGRIKIDTGGTTLGRWLADGLRQTFRLP